MALSTPPLPNFYGRSAGGKTTPPAAPYHSSAAATATAGIPMCGNNPSASARLQQALLPAHVAQGLAECGHLPWDPAELFALHQHFFSPPPKPKAALSPQHRPQYPAAHGQQQLQPQRASGLGARKRDELEEEEEGGSKDPASNGGHRQEHAPLQAPPPLLPPQPFLRVESECLFPPACKKQCVTTTTAIPPGRAPVRMGRYPRLKARVELMLKGGVTQEHAVLILLRQLRFLEGQQQQTATTSLAPEHIEAILLDTDGLEIVPMGGR